MYRRSSESRMRSGKSRGVSKCSRRKDRYIGRLYSDIGKVPSDSGIFGSTGELREFYWALMGHTGKERKASKGGRTPPHGLVRIGLGRGAPPSFLPLFSSLSFPPTPTTWKGRNPTPTGSRTPPGRAIGAAPLPLLHSFIYVARGHPIDTTIDP